MTQSSPSSPPTDRPAAADLPWLAWYSLRGLLELVRARLIFARFQARDIVARNRIAKEVTAPAAAIDHQVVSRIAYVIPRLSDRLPWRSDCVIQAIAGQNWLKSKKAPSEIQIGVENPTDGKFGAHAWLVHDSTIVTGGDIDHYELLLSDSRLAKEMPEQHTLRSPESPFLRP